MGKIAIAQITIADLSDPIISGSAPSNPVNDMLWLDTSVSPNVLKRYSNGAWVVVNDTSSLVERITTAEQKITDDAIVSTVRTSTQYKNDLSGKVDNSKLEEYSTIEQTSDAITSAVSGVQVGGRNLLKNSSFSENFDKWARSGASNAPYEITTDDGYKCAHIDVVESSSRRVSQDVIDMIKNDPYGQLYSFSADVKLENYVAGATNPYIQLYADGHYYTDDGTVAWNPSTSYFKVDKLNGLGWSRISYAFSYRYPVAIDANIMIHTGNCSGDLYFKNLKLERGNKATDWTPAPEDTDGKIDTVSNSISQVKQTADKINWLVASGDSVSNMQMTSEAYTLISENITLTADKINAVADDINLAGNNTVKITSADQITAEAAKNIDLSANESVKVTAAKINAVADDIDLSGNNTVHISSADQIDISAVNDLNLSSNGTISLIAGRVDDLEDDAIYDSATPPATATAGKKWLDRGVEPAQLRRWKGLTTTPNGGTMTTAREIEESASGRVISLDNSENQIDGTLSVVVQGKNLLNLYALCDAITSVQGGTIGKYPENGGFDITATANDAYTNPWNGANYNIPVRPNTTYTLSWDIYMVPATGTSMVMYFIDHRFETGYYGQAAYDTHKLTFTTPSDAQTVSFRFGVQNSGDTVGYANLQLEEGSTQTTFSTYKNVVTVTRCGKNLAKDAHSLGDTVINGITFHKHTTGAITVSGTATANAIYALCTYATHPLIFENGATYWLYLTSNSNDASTMKLYANTYNSGTSGAVSRLAETASGSTTSFTGNGKALSELSIVVYAGKTINMEVMPMIVKGTELGAGEYYDGTTIEVPLETDWYHGWNVEIESQSGLNNILTDADAMSVDYACTGWETIGDTSELQRTVDQNTLDAARIEAIANEADQLSKENAANFKRVVEIQEGADGGLIVGDNLSNCSIKIKSASIELRVNNTAVATYAQDYVRLQDMQIRVPAGVGGLVLSKFG